MKRRRRSHRRRKNHTVRNIVICCFVITLFLATGYSAFQTVININAKGNIKIMYASDTVKKLSKSNSLTMFTDPFGNIRYTGSNEDVRNYVCLVDESPCQDKHLFRIIGSFINIDDGNGKLETRVKVIKASSAFESKWDDSNNNDWNQPATLKTKLNTTYYNSLDIDVKNVIGNAIWNIGAIPHTTFTSQQVYLKERGDIGCSSNSSSLITDGIFALMYASDYGYASSSCYSSKQLANNSSNDYRLEICTGTNWLYIGIEEWTLTSITDEIGGVTRIYNKGSVDYGSNYAGRYNYPIRPVVFLKHNSLLITKNHDGTSTNPYIVKINI